MGAYLSQPITDKVTESGANSVLAYGVASMQGWRTEMEDAHLCELDLDSEMSLFGVFDGHGGKEVAIFASLYLAKEFLSAKEFQTDDIDVALKHSFLSIDELVASPSSKEELYKLSLEQMEEVHPKEDGDSKFEKEEEDEVSSFPIGMESLMVDTESDEEEEPTNENGFQTHLNGNNTQSMSSRILALMFPFGCLRSKKTQKRKIKKHKTLQVGGAGLINRTDSVPPKAVNSHPGLTTTSPPNAEKTKPIEMTTAGCTAVVAVITKQALHVANAGDSRCVLCRDGEAVPMSRDHKPTDPDEYTRIHCAGGYVFEGRVNGCLNLSRAIGDLEYKEPKGLPPEKQMITANPEIKTIDLRSGDQFVILACDGIWDVLTHQQACDFVTTRLEKKMELQDICIELCDACLAEDSTGSGEGCDNMTVAIILLKEYSTI